MTGNSVRKRMKLKVKSSCVEVVVHLSNTKL